MPEHANICSLHQASYFDIAQIIAESSPVAEHHRPCLQPFEFRREKYHILATDSPDEGNVTLNARPAKQKAKRKTPHIELENAN
jgi:hypothetical protein